MPPRLAAVVVPVYLTGIVVTVAAAASFATSPRSLLTLVGIAGLLAASTFSERYPVPLDGIDTGGVSLTFVFAVATIVLYGWQAGVIVGFAAPVMQLLEHRPPLAGWLQRLRARRCGCRGRRGAGAAPRLECGAHRRSGRDRGARPLHGQRDPDQRRRRDERAEARARGCAVELLGHATPFRADGLRSADPRRPLGALSGSLRRAHRSAARDRALPAFDVPRVARDAARADRPADGARQPPPFPRSARARARRLVRAGLSAQRLPDRHRRLQADQRPLRPSRRRQGAGAARHPTPPGRRGVPARRGRVRHPPPRP